jgi:hypothetical protein
MENLETGSRRLTKKSTSNLRWAAVGSVLTTQMKKLLYRPSESSCKGIFKGLGDCLTDCSFVGIVGVFVCQMSAHQSKTPFDHVTIGVDIELLRRHCRAPKRL